MSHKNFKPSFTYWMVTNKKNKVHIMETSTKKVATFQESMKVTLVIGQVFSLIPVNGIWSNDASKIKFVKMSWKCIYALISVAGHFFLAAMSFYSMFVYENKLQAAIAPLFFGTISLTMVMFIRIGQRWPRLAQHIAIIEEMTPNFDSKLIKKCNMTCIFIFILALYKKTPTKKLATFQESMKVTLIIGQVFSLIPVNGIWSNDVSKIKFVKTSWKCIYASIFLAGHSLMAGICLYIFALSEVKIYAAIPLIFMVTTYCAVIMFIRIGQRWPSLVQHIAKTEELNSYFDSTLSKKCNNTCIFMCILALLEQSLYLLFIFTDIFSQPHVSVYEIFMKNWMYNVLQFSPLLAVLVQFLIIQSTFIWSFSNLFVICISYYLTSRLEQVNKKLIAAQGKYLPENFWMKMREDYGRVTQLVQKVDDVISGIILISFANNLFSVCLQLYNMFGFISFGGYGSKIFSVYSTIFLIGRSIAALLITSQIHTASSVPASVLYDVPSPVYNLEVQRFLEQVNGSKVALSGLQFFYVTRKLFLTVVGTIVTYELILFQFDPSLKSNITSTVLLNATTTFVP